MSTFELEIDRSNSARLKVIGCGGAGGNAVNRMIGAGLRGVEFIAANTDMQALAQSLAPTRIQIGVNTTRGLGSGGDPSIGRRSAEEDEVAITDAVADADDLQPRRRRTLHLEFEHGHGYSPCTGCTAILAARSR